MGNEKPIPKPTYKESFGDYLRRLEAKHSIKEITKNYIKYAKNENIICK